MLILVTGGAGFVGTNLIKRLLKEGHEVVSIDDYSTGKKENHIDHKNVQYVKRDLLDIDPNDFNYKPALIYHLAAKARIQPSFEQPEEYIRVNYEGTYNMIRLAKKKNISLIYAGSSSHHSGKFKNPYTFSKDMGEDIVKLYREHFNLRASIVRFYNVYGPHQLTEGGYTTLIGRWIHNIETNQPCFIYGDGTKRRDFTHVEDIVDGLYKILELGKYGHDFELGRGKNYSVNEVAEFFGIKEEVVYEPGKPGEAQSTLCTDSKAKEILGWVPTINLEDYIQNGIANFNVIANDKPSISFDHFKTQPEVTYNVNEFKGFTTEIDSKLDNDIWSGGDYKWKIESIKHIINKLKPKVIVETGFATGRSSTVFLNFCEQFNIKTKMYSFEHNKNSKKHADKLSTYFNNFNFILADTKSQDMINYLKDEIKKIDLYFCDGNKNLYENDINAIYPYMNKGGYILMDDGWHNSVSQLAYKIAKEKKINLTLLPKYERKGFLLGPI
tara:strand:+ start:678 stop:2171 length:1494 start_codon:yes stop_codon:yes gene_type:complete